jgi:zinc protease
VRPPAPPAAPVAAAPAPVDELDQVLPLDARIRRGTLPSGLRYFLVPHRTPEKRAELWLAVNAGAVQEDDDQRGLAHFVEHMGFNGTRRFPKSKLVDALEAIGMKFGPDLNAYTSFDETVYKLRIPTDKPELVAQALRILRDWASDVSFEPIEVEKERGVVLEEWRLGRGAGRRVIDKQLPVIFAGSKYADRLPIGLPEIIKTASPEVLRRFYRDWYRPDLMALIAVGDFDPALLEKGLLAEFGNLPAAQKTRPRTVVPVPLQEKTLVTIATDRELPTTTVSVASRLPSRGERTAREYRRSLMEQLYHGMLNARLDEVRRRADAPFLFASSGARRLVRAIDVIAATAVVKEDGVLAGLGALLEELNRVKKHGFLESELLRARSRMLRRFEQEVTERDKKEGKELAAELTRHYFVGEAVPGIEAELALVRRFVPKFTLAELNQLAGSLDVEKGRVITITGPERMKKPSEAEVLAVVGQYRDRAVAASPYRDGVSQVSLLAQLPPPGQVLSTRKIEAIGVTEWTLSNGARVVIKPTHFRNDQVSLTAFAPGGHSLVKDRDYDNARVATHIVGESGLGSFDPVQLRKLLAGKVVQINPWVGELQQGLTGGAAPADLETLLQLVHLSFTAPRRDVAAFEAWRGRDRERLRNRLLIPEQRFADELTALVTQKHFRRRPPTVQALEKLDLDGALRIYRDRFADASAFTFVFVGNIDAARLQPLVERYLASLPKLGRKERWRDVGVRFPRGKQVKEVRAGSEPKSVVVLTFHGAQRWSRDAQNDLSTLREVLSTRLREILREDLGGVYHVGVQGSISRRPRQEFTLTINFGCAPEKVELLRKAIFDEIKELKAKGIPEAYLVKVRESRRRAHEISLKRNRFWVSKLQAAYTHGDDPREILDIEPWIAKVTSARVQAAARRYLGGNDYVLAVLRPEAGGATGGAAPPAPAPAVPAPAAPAR